MKTPFASFLVFVVTTVGVSGVRAAASGEALLHAAEAGQLAVLEAAKSVGANLYYVDSQDMNVLGYAVRGEHPAMINWLMDPSNFDLRHTDKTPAGVVLQAGASGLAEAAAHGDTELVKKLLDAGIDPDLAHSMINLLNPALAAARNKHMAVVKLLLKNGAKRDDSYNNDTVASCIITQKDIEALHLLIEVQGHDVNDFDSHGLTLIAQAAKQGWFDGAIYLLNHGADPLKADLDGHTAVSESTNGDLKKALAVATIDSPLAAKAADMWLAIEHHDLEAFRQALNKETANLKNSKGETPLLFSVVLEQEEFVRLLLKAGAEPDQMNEVGSTPLALACWKGYRDIANLLLEAGADVELAEGVSATPLAAAAGAGHDDIVRMLLDKGAHADPRDLPARTGLMLASMNKHKVIVKLLLDAKANPNAVDRQGNAVLGYAILSDDPEMLQLLLDAGAARDYMNPPAFGNNAASLAMHNNKLRSLRMLTELGLRDPIAAAKVIERNQPGTEAVVQYLRAHYSKEAEEAVFWSGKPSVTEIAAHLQQGGDMNFSGDATPLQKSLLDGRPDIARYLLDHGAVVNQIGTAVANSPLQLCFRLRPFGISDEASQELIRFFLEKGADPGDWSQKNLDEPPLFTAIDKGWADTVRLMIQHGANPDQRNILGWTATDALAQTSRLTDTEKQALRQAFETARVKLHPLPAMHF